LVIERPRRFYGYLLLKFIKVENENELIDQVDDYIAWYNEDRPQEKLNFKYHVIRSP